MIDWSLRVQWLVVFRQSRNVLAGRGDFPGIWFY